MFRKSPILSLLLAVLAYFALWLLVPKATFLPAIVNDLTSSLKFVNPNTAAGIRLFSSMLMAAPTVAFMAIQIAIIYFFTKLNLKFRQALLALVLCIVSIAGLVSFVIWQAGIAAKLGHYPNLKEQLILISYYQGILKMPYILFIMFASINIGYLVSLRVLDKNLLLPVVMFAACVDLWTVTQGPVAAMLNKVPEVASAVSAPIPQVGTGAFMPSTLIGPGDFIFMALVFAAVHRLKMNAPRNYLYIFVSMTIGMLTVMFGILPFFPALITLAIAVVAANRREFNLSRQEKVSTAIVGILLFASLPLVWSILRPSVEEGTKKPAVSTSSKNRDK